MLPTSKKLKKPWAIKGWLGLLYAQDFLTLAPKPAKVTSHSLRPTMGYIVRIRAAVVVNPAVTARELVGTGAVRAGLLRGAASGITLLTTHRNEKVRSHMRIDCSPAPQPTPRHLCLHIFCN